MATPALSLANGCRFFLAALFLSAGAIATAADATPGANLALGKTYTLAPRPEYEHCTDPGDDVQLTDGQLTEGYFWVQQGTVGWTHVPCAAITVDLGRVEPVSGVSLRTAAGAAGVSWPAAVRIAVSDDGKQFRDVGDLVAMDLAKQGAWPEGYAVRRLVTHDLTTRGRFVQLLIVTAGGGFVFADEVEVFRGPDALLQADPGGKPVGDVAERITEMKLLGGIRRRFASDAAGLRRAIDETPGVDEPVKRELLARADEVGKKLASSPFVPEPTFRAVMPYNDEHAGVFALQAAMWKATGRPAITAWAPNTWDPVPLFAAPPTGPAGKIEVHAMRGEFRAAALNLANATDGPMRARLHFEGLPGSPAPGYIAVAEVPWTDTAEGQPVAAALPEVQPQADGWPIAVLPGMVRQVWMTVHATDVEPGTYAGTAVVTCEGQEPLRIPIELHVYPATFPKETTLLLGGWSYTNGKGVYGVTDQNREALLAHLQDRFVNAPWATGSVMLKFEVVGGQVKLDTAEFDQWIARWPKAKKYMVFLALANNSGASKDFHGTTLGTPEFERLAGAWISAWVGHLRTKGIGPDRLGLLIHDEPNEGVDVEPLVAWARAIRAAEPDVLIWNDPIYRQPAKAPAALFETSDVLCPNRPMWLAGGKAFAEFYLDQQRQGRTLHFYSCSGPARLLDPYSYYRLQAWHCWQVGATGSFFWAYGDNGGASSFNEYLSKHGPYTPLFVDEASVTPGKQMEAVRESVEDYETLVMLRAAVDRAKAAGRGDAAVAEAESLLKTAAAEVLDDAATGWLRWETPKDRTRADAVRVNVLQALGSLER